MKAMNESKYIIPFLGYNDETKKYDFIGSSFLIKPNFLITAGHNIGKQCNKKFKTFAIFYKNKYIVLESPVFYEYSEEFVIKGDYKDIAIYKLNMIVEEAFNLSNHILEKNDKLNVCEVPEFYLENLNLVKQDVTVYLPTYSYRNYPKQMKSRLTKYENCFNLKEKLEFGFSGGPIFKDNNVFGMIVYGPNESEVTYNRQMEFGATALKSNNYIFNIIHNLKRFNK